MTTPTATTLVFVYGTLKRNGCRNQVLVDQEFIDHAETLPEYGLYSLGAYPGLVESPEDGDAISGEIYRVDAACLDRLDDIEAVDEGLYRRDIVNLQSPHDLVAVQAWFYDEPLPPDATRIVDWQ